MCEVLYMEDFLSFMEGKELPPIHNTTVFKGEQISLFESLITLEHLDFMFQPKLFNC